MGAEFWDRESLGKPWAHLCFGQNQLLPSMWLVGFSLDVPEAGAMLPRNSVIWGERLDFCFSRFNTHWDHFISGMGEFNSDDHCIYYCGQESLRRNGVAIMVNKRVRSAVPGCNLKNDRRISVHFQSKPFNITVIQVCAQPVMLKKQKLNGSMKTSKTF